MAANGISTQKKSSKSASWIFGMTTLSITVGIGAFISIPLAIFLSGVMCLTYTVSREIKRRKHWEINVDHRLGRMGNDIERIDFENTRNTNDVHKIKNSLNNAGKKMRTEISKGRTSYQALKGLSEDLQKTGAQPRTSALARVQTHQQRIMNLKKHNAANDASALYSENNTRTRALQQTLKKAIEGHKIKTFTQPIVKMHGRIPLFQEIYSRILFRDEAYMPASRFVDTAKQKGYITHIDSVALAHALKNITSLSSKQHVYFVNISTHTLKSGRFMSRLLSVLSKKRSIAPFLIFELQQADFETLDSQSFDILKGLSDLGCGISIDNVSGLDLSMNLVRALNIRFVKLGVPLLKKIIADNPFGNTKIKDLQSNLEQHNTHIILERIETEQDINRFAQFNFKYGQGHLFSRPKQHAVAA